MKKNLTLTMIVNTTANYGESLGNISSIQKTRRNGELFAIRTKESIGYSIKEQSGMNNTLSIIKDGKVAQIENNEERNAANCPALDFGYMTTAGKQTIRKRAIRITDMVSAYKFDNDYQFRNNLGIASIYSKANGCDLKDGGLMPYNYEYDKSYKIYSITIDLDRIGKDENYDQECSNEEKAKRVNLILDTIQHLILTVKGYTDNAEPLFVIGGLSDYATHVFENVVKIKKNSISVSDDLINKYKNGDYSSGIMEDSFENSSEVKEKLGATTVDEFFSDLKEKVSNNYLN